MKKILLVLIFSLLTAANSFAQQTYIEVRLVGDSGDWGLASPNPGSAAVLTSDIGFPDLNSVDVGIEVRLVGIYSIENLKFSDFDFPTFSEATVNLCDGAALSEGQTCVLSIAFAPSEADIQNGTPREDTFKITYNYEGDQEETPFDVYVKVRFTPDDTSGISEVPEKIPAIKFLGESLNQAIVTGPALVSVFTLGGKIVLSEISIPKNSENVIDMSTWKTGFYFIEAKNAKGYKATMKISIVN